MSSYLTRSEAEQLIADAIKHSVQAANSRTNNTVSGFAARLFNRLPKLIADTLAESNPGLALDTQILTSKLSEAFAEQFPVAAKAA